MSVIKTVALLHYANDGLLYARPVGREVFVNIGGVVKPGEPFREALIRIVYEQIKVRLEKEHIHPLQTFSGRQEENPQNEVDLYGCEYGEPFPSEPVLHPLMTKLQYLQLKDILLTEEIGRQILRWSYDCSKIK